MKTPNLIISSDEHIRSSKPVARIDDFWSALVNKITFLKELQKKYNNIPIISGGDLLDKANISSKLETWCIKNFPFIVTIPGNHELENHNMSLYEKSSLCVLEAAKTVRVLKGKKTEEEYDCYYIWYDKSKLIAIVGYPWGEEIVGYKVREEIDRNIAVCHYLVYESDNIFPNLKTERAIDLLKRLSCFDLIITGHNHLPFIVEHEGRLLVNPGSMLRSFANQLDHRPRIYFYYAEDNTIEPVYYPIEPAEKVLTREHIEVKKEKDSRMFSYVLNLKNDMEFSASFEGNMEEYLNMNSVKGSTKNTIYEFMRGVT